MRSNSNPEKDIAVAVPMGCARIVEGFAAIMGMSISEAARHLLITSAADLASSPGFRHLIGKDKESSK